MFETVELGNRISKEAFKKESISLREKLLKAQSALAKADFSLIILVGGVEGAGRATLVDLMLEWLDPRGIEVHALGEPSDEERERPRFWRFWRLLPPKGKAAILLGSWYTDPIVHRAFRDSGKAALDRDLDRIVDFEKMLANEGVLLVKLWLHLTRAQQRKRLKELEKDPDTRWRVTKKDWEFAGRYDRFRKICERAVLKTSTAHAPWNLVEAADFRYTKLAAMKMVLKAMTDRLAQPPAERPAKGDLPKPKRVNPIRSLDLSLRLKEAESDKLIEDLQARFNTLSRKMRDEDRSMILVFEGPDAAGKGGAIRRLTRAMDARNCRVVSTAAPNDEERARPYLWRFWRGLPRLGRVTIYDRSWYGRVLVERLEGFCRPEDWKRAYGEINAFEEELSESGVVIVKYWLAISQEEQLKRFKERQATPYKQYKITEEDWRNRAKWGAYEAGACDMIEKTSTSWAPWVLVEGNDKRWARVKVLRSACEKLEEALQ